MGSAPPKLGSFATIGPRDRVPETGKQQDRWQLNRTWAGNSFSTLHFAGLRMLRTVETDAVESDVNRRIRYAILSIHVAS